MGVCIWSPCLKKRSTQAGLRKLCKHVQAYMYHTFVSIHVHTYIACMYVDIYTCTCVHTHVSLRRLEIVSGPRCRPRTTWGCAHCGRRFARAMWCLRPRSGSLPTRQTRRCMITSSSCHHVHACIHVCNSQYMNQNDVLNSHMFMRNGVRNAGPGKPPMAWIHAYIHVSLCMHEGAFMYICTCTYVHMYILTYLHT
jgi:hypothetical protein